MAFTISFFLVTREVAVRSGVLKARYRIADGRFVLDNKDLSRIKLTDEELIGGIQGIEKTTESEAKKLISENGYKLGDSKVGENDYD